MKKLSNTGAELKNNIAYKKKTCITDDLEIFPDGSDESDEE